MKNNYDEYVEASKSFNKMADECIKNNMTEELEIAFDHFLELYGIPPMHDFELAA